MTSGHLILAAGALLAGSAAAALVAARLRFPALLLFLAIGMAAGKEGRGWINFNEYAVARELGSVALGLILFDGGLRAGFKEIRAVIAPSLRLAVGGTMIVAAVTSVAATVLFQLSPLQGLLLGSIIASTDSAAVFSLLRGSTLSRRLATTLEGEAGFNDPVALMLVIGFMEWIRRPDYGLGDMALLAVREVFIGAACGYVVAWLATAALTRMRAPSSGLYPVASVAVAALAYGSAASLHGSAFLAVFLAGLMLGDARIPGRQTVAVFHDGVAWVAQIGLFLALGLLVNPGQLGAVAPEGAALGIFVVVIARPVATMIATARQSFTTAEKVILSCAGMRGGAPIVFATFPVAAGVPGSKGIFDIVFFAVVVSTVLQGLTFEPLARRLGLIEHAPPLPRPLVEYGASRRLGAEFVEYPVTAVDGVVGRLVRHLDLPFGATLAVIVRGEEAVTPEGSALLMAGDVLHMLVREEMIDRVPDLLDQLSSPRSTPTRTRVPDGLAGDAGPGGLVTETWRASHGDPAVPDRVSGVHVVERLLMRYDRRGAVVRLEDGRHAITGATMTVGTVHELRRYATRRVAVSALPDETVWWRSVVATLAP